MNNEGQPRGSPNISHQNLSHHIPSNISQPLVSAFVEEGEAFVVEAEDVQDCGVEVMDVDGVFGGAEAEVVGGAVGQAALHRTASQPASQTE